MSKATELKTGDSVPVLVEGVLVEAEVYEVKEGKVLIRHSDWEWLKLDDDRLFPSEYDDAAMQNEDSFDSSDTIYDIQTHHAIKDIESRDSTHSNVITSIIYV